jgi:hypothetical protein
MKNVAVVSFLLILLVSACAPMVPRGERYANELAGNQLLAKHSDYFKGQYAGTTRDEAYWAYRAILEGELLAVQYDLALKAMNKEERSKAIVSNMKLTKDALLAHLANYSSVWSKAIHDHVHYKYSSVDFSTALGITKKEYTRIGIFSKIDLIKGQIKSNISAYDKQKYPKTYELYAVLSQLMDLAEEPKGSSMTFNSTVNSLNSDFSKTLALAELEF